MDATLATLITGLSAAGVGLGSALLSHLTLRKQMNLAAVEQAANRKHALTTSVISRVAEATEFAWLYLHRLHINQGLITEGDTTNLIAKSIWLPDEVRATILEVISNNTNVAQVSAAQKEILQFVNSLTGDRNANRS